MASVEKRPREGQVEKKGEYPWDLVTRMQHASAAAQAKRTKMPEEERKRRKAERNQKWEASWRQKYRRLKGPWVTNELYDRLTAYADEKDLPTPAALRLLAEEGLWRWQEEKRSRSGAGSAEGESVATATDGPTGGGSPPG